MRDAFYRLTSPILEWIPDISHQPQSRQVSIGLAASLVFHLLLLLLALAVGFVLPKHSLGKFAPPKPKLQEIELTVLPPPPVVEEVRVLPLDEAKPFIDSRGLAASGKPPENADFQSGKDMRAASEVPARGDAPLPSQDGRASAHGPEFLKQQATVGKTLAPAPVEPAAPPPEPPSISMAKSAPPTPEVAPAAPSEPAKPTPLKEVDAPAPGEIALAKKPAAAAEASPAPAAPRIPKFRADPKITLAKLSTPAPLVPPKPESGYQPEQTATRIDGNISNRGKKSVNAKGTPLGRYQEGVGNAVGARWNAYVKGKGDLVALGSVRVRFTIDRKGRVGGVRIEENTSNSAFATVCERSVIEAEIRPPGPDLSNLLRDGKLEMTFTFTLY